MRDILPDEVFDEIAAHIRNRVPHAEEGWKAGSAEEDTITGDLGSALRTRHPHSITTGGVDYKWSLSYKKFLSKSKRSVEKRLGADGIFQVEYEDLATGEMTTKGLLFQSKNQWTGRNKKLLSQTDDMERFLPGGGAVFDYSPRGYTACDAAQAIAAEGRRSSVPQSEMLPLGDYLINRFMECTSGVRGIYYDATRNVLLVPDQRNGFDEHRFFIETRFRIEVLRIP
ncbi:MAG TPA: hypothetical protein VLB76_11665 [Thermoanaerobaculia bacterium]|jgi:hypothetical protein|nr:hypothetical protein [Thermoanaerobaculia bacterium]